MNNERIEKLTITDAITLSLINLKKVPSCMTCKTLEYNKITSKWACMKYPGMTDKVACGEYDKEK
jgi:hypothetical protein